MLEGTLKNPYPWDFSTRRVSNIASVFLFMCLHARIGRDSSALYGRLEVFEDALKK